MAVNGSSASLLIVAGAGKLVSPMQPLHAAQEVFGRHGDALTTRAIRALALVELATAVALLVPATRTVAAITAAALGAAFAAFGIAGRLGRSTLACGCLGRGHGSPPGVVNIAVGAALSSTLAWNLLAGLPAEYARDALLAAASASLALCLWVHRALIHALLPRQAVR